MTGVEPNGTWRIYCESELGLVCSPAIKGYRRMETAVVPPVHSVFLFHGLESNNLYTLLLEGSFLCYVWCLHEVLSIPNYNFFFSFCVGVYRAGDVAAAVQSRIRKVLVSNLYRESQLSLSIFSMILFYASRQMRKCNACLHLTASASPISFPPHFDPSTRVFQCVQ